MAVRVLMRGEAIPAPSGRADDFRWPRGGGTPEALPEPAVAAAAPSAQQRGTVGARTEGQQPQQQRAATPQQQQQQANANSTPAPQQNRAESSAPQPQQQRRVVPRTPTAELPPRQQQVQRPSGSIPQPNYFRN
jgi:hypothetical protein